MEFYSNCANVFFASPKHSVSTNFLGKYAATNISYHLLRFMHICRHLLTRTIMFDEVFHIFNILYVCRT